MSKKSLLVVAFYGLVLCMSNVRCGYANAAVYRLPYEKGNYCVKNSKGEAVCNFPEESSLEIAKCSLVEGGTFCTNQDGEPITGEVLKFKNGLIMRRFVLKDGYLDGVGEAFDRNGYMIATLDYSHGKLNGYVNSFNRNGVLTSKIPYVEGKKEGIAEYVGDNTTVKTIYIDGQLNGSAQIWSNKDKKKIYDLEMSENYISRAIYYHYDKCSYEGDNPLIKEEEVPPLLIDALNLDCAEVLDEFSEEIFPVKLKLSQEKCQMWVSENQDELTSVVEQFKCHKNKK